MQNKIVGLPKESDPQVLNSLGYAALDNKKFDDALKFFTDALNMGSTNVATTLGRAESLVGLKRYFEAIGDYDTIIASGKYTANIIAHRGHAKLSIGIAENSAQSIEAAISDFTEAIHLSPRDAYGYYSRGLAYHELAKEAFKKCLEINPNYIIEKQHVENLEDIEIDREAGEFFHKTTLMMGKVNDDMAYCYKIGEDLHKNKGYKPTEVNWRSVESLMRRKLPAT